MIENLEFQQLKGEILNMQEDFLIKQNLHVETPAPAIKIIRWPENFFTKIYLIRIKYQQMLTFSGTNKISYTV